MIDLKLSNGTKLDIQYPIELKDENGNIVYRQYSYGTWEKSEYTNGECTYSEISNGYWVKSEYTDGKRTYYENSDGYWAKFEYTDVKCTYWEDSDGNEWGTPKSNKKQAILDQIEVLKKQAEEL